MLTFSAGFVNCMLAPPPFFVFKSDIIVHAYGFARVPASLVAPDNSGVAETASTQQQRQQQRQQQQQQPSSAGRMARTTAFAALVSLYGEPRTQAVALALHADAILRADAGADASTAVSNADSNAGARASKSDRMHAASHAATETPGTCTGAVVHALEGPMCSMGDAAADDIVTAVGATPSEAVFSRRRKSRPAPAALHAAHAAGLPHVCVVTVSGRVPRDHWQLVDEVLQATDCHLVACKHAQHVESFQARVLSPFEIGDPKLKRSVALFCRNGLFAAVFAGRNCCSRIKAYVACGLFGRGASFCVRLCAFVCVCVRLCAFVCVCVRSYAFVLSSPVLLLCVPPPPSPNTQTHTHTRC